MPFSADARSPTPRVKADIRMIILTSLDSSGEEHQKGAVFADEATYQNIIEFLIKISVAKVQYLD